MGVCPFPLPENVNYSPKYWPQRNQPFAVLPALHSVEFLKTLQGTSSISRLVIQQEGTRRFYLHVE